jgi:2-methylcitrate dehydratase PrpD
MATIAEQLAEFVVATDDRLAPALLERAGVHVLDLLAVALAGSTAASSQPVIRLVRESSGGRPEATVYGVGRIATAADAALANGTMAHALELDDDHRTGTVHQGAVVVPAALAACEAASASGVTFLRAVLLGYEVMCRVGEAFGGRQFYAGFHPTGTCGVFGSVVAAAVAFGLDRDALVRAFGIAGTQASGLAEWRTDGSWIKRLHPGRAAQSGVMAARLARHGFTGPATILEGPSGFLRAFSFEGSFDRDVITRGLGTEFRTMITAFKPYPCCRFSHGAVDLALDLHRHGITASRIRSVHVRIYKTDILNYVHRPPTPVDAQFCLPFLVAMALVRGRVGLSDLGPDAIRDPAVLALSDRVTVDEDPGFTAQYPERYPTELTVITTEGEELTRFNDCPRGDPEAPEYVGDPRKLYREVEDKVRALLTETGFGDRAEPLIRATATLTHAPRVTALAELVS